MLKKSKGVVMVYYHCTIINRLDKILNDGLLEHTDATNTQYSKDGSLSTTFGYVYMCKYLLHAVHFALQPSKDKRDVIEYKMGRVY